MPWIYPYPLALKGPSGEGLLSEMNADSISTVSSLMSLSGDKAETTTSR